MHCSRLSDSVSGAVNIIPSGCDSQLRPSRRERTHTNTFKYCVGVTEPASATRADNLSNLSIEILFTAAGFKRSTKASSLLRLAAGSHITPCEKFGKQIQKRQLEVPEYAASFVNYKALKKLIKKLSATPKLAAQNDPLRPYDAHRLAVSLAGEQGKVLFPVGTRIREGQRLLSTERSRDKKRVLQSRQGVSRSSTKFATLQEGFQQFANDLNKLQQHPNLRRRELYLSRAVEVQPFFNATVISELSDQATTSLQELGAWAEGDNVSFEQRPEHIISSQHLLGTDEGDADSLLLDTAISGNLDSLRDLLTRMRSTADPTPVAEMSLMERVTRTFLASIHEAPQPSLELLLQTGLVDIQSEDDINERNCLHQATIYGNGFVLGVGLSGNVAVNRTDVYGRVPLHYASMHGRLDMLDALLQADPTTIDLIDHDNFTPLIRAIIHGHLACVERLLATSSRLDPKSDTDHAPLNLACEHGSLEIVELLLRNGAQILPDAEGLYPQHLVARSGQTPQLLMLLKQHGADLDQIDKLYGWTPLVHAASEGNVPCLRELLNIGADANIHDEKDLPAMYYAAWEGHLECMQLLSQFLKSKKKSPNGMQAHLAPMMSSGPVPMSLDVDAIPVLELPPPIIPLRRYGHNFLDTKTVVQISFEQLKDQPLVFFQDSKYPASRLTISSKASDLIPKNIILPFQEDTRLVSFQVEDLESFTLDFDVFPAYGAKVIAKTVALPNTFRAVLGRSGRCCLPLFDPRLRAIGQISFNTQVIKPFQGMPLEITDFETYWKATSQVDRQPNTFVTGSSLSGDFVQLFVQHTSDGVPVLWPSWHINCGGVEVSVARLSYAQFGTVTTQSPSRAHIATLPSQAMENIADVHRILATAGVSLQEALALLPKGMHVNLQILYPSEEEERGLGLGPAIDVNNFVDAILTVVFDHARSQRTLVKAPDVVRSVVFSSYNPTLCTTLNWKQPNFPVFLCNDLGHEEATPAPSVIQASGRRTSSIKEVVRIAQNNNFMGLICCSRLLDMVPALVDAIKSNGLALVIDKSTEQPQETHPLADPFPRMPKGVDGILKNNGVLRFNESIDV
ncbi:hypothetical protein PG994_001298 [Apiospora phragmitis]|uniref:Ankyrin repeat protein nuc-2 n=1 Tax=Apiospora phragmitis TaxID=2905665 RepID=A0ABR1WT52_9PEZI